MFRFRGAQPPNRRIANPIPALQLTELDERTLKDIGLDRHAGCAFAARVCAYREQELRRMAMARLGLM